MGSHPIFESDFDCLTEFFTMAEEQKIATIADSDTVKKTSETFAEVGDSIGKAFSGFGIATTSKLAEMKSSPSFQSFEQKTMGLFGRTSQTATPAATSPVAEPAKDEPL